MIPSWITLTPFDPEDSMRRQSALRAPYSLARSSAWPDEGFDTLDALARRIHRLRRGAPIALARVVLGRAGPRVQVPAVAVNTLDEVGERIALLGYATGAETAALRYALERAAPPPLRAAEQYEEAA